MYIELCINYNTSGFPDFKPVCKLGYKAGLWCHKFDAPHFCNAYLLEENINEK
jgi:hypothetical protein